MVHKAVTYTPEMRWLREAYLVAGQSEDPSTQVGAVILDSWGKGLDKQPAKIASACNEVVEGSYLSEEQWQDRDLKYKMVMHAEAGAICKAHRYSRKLPYCLVGTWCCCVECAKVVVSSGVRVVVRHQDAVELGHWDLELADGILRAGGVEIVEWRGRLHVGVRMNGKEVEL